MPLLVMLLSSYKLTLQHISTADLANERAVRELHRAYTSDAVLDREKSWCIRQCHEMVTFATVICSALSTFSTLTVGLRSSKNLS